MSIVSLMTVCKSLCYSIGCSLSLLLSYIFISTYSMVRQVVYFCKEIAAI